MLTLLFVQAYLLSRWHRSNPWNHHQKSTTISFKSSIHLELENQSKRKGENCGTIKIKSCDPGILWWWPVFGFGSLKEIILYPSKPQPLEVFDKNRNTIRINCIENSFTTAAEIKEPREGLAGMSLEDKFRAAVKVIHSLPKDGPYQPSNGTKLKFYGLYKQATDGPCNTARPAFWDMIGRYKWDAWKTLGTMSLEEAMTQYVDGLKEIVETMSFDGNVQDFLESIGPFYEFVNLQGSQLNHIKDTLDRLTSSESGSSSSGSSITTSPINSCPNSPLKSLEYGDNDKNQEETDSAEVSPSSSTVVQVHVDTETKTATFENTIVKANGYSNKYNRIHEIPPSPMHTYNPRKSSLALQQSMENGIEEQDEEEENDENEIISRMEIIKPCKEDLEEQEDASGTGKNKHVRLRDRVSLDTIATTSGTESEKYYSGDSEPDFEDKLLIGKTNGRDLNAEERFLVVGRGSQHTINNETHQNGITRGILVNGNGVNSRRQKSSLRNHNNEGLNQLVSPVRSTSQQRTHNGEIVLQNTIDRLNRDIDHILARLRILETAYASSVGVSSSEQSRLQNGRSRRFFFGGMSYSAVAFVLLWPFAVHFLIKLLSWWWNARRRRVLSKLPRLL